MNRITINLDPMPDGSAVGIMVEVISLDPDKPGKPQRHPLNSASPVEVSVDPGRYLVQAIRADGELLAATVDATRDSSSARLEHPEPPESTKNSVLAKDPLAGPQWPPLELIAIPCSGVDSWVRKHYLDARVGGLRNKLFPILLRTVARWSTDRVSIVDSPFGALRYGEPNRAAWALRSANAPSSAIVRFPQPLFPPRGVIGEVDVELIESAPDSIRLVPSDPSVSTLAAFITRGDVLTAAQLAPDLWQSAVAKLRSKRACPPAAVIAGYLLVATEQRDSTHEWTDWIENLANWFEDIPDGAIFSGWRALRNREVDRARSRFEEAIQRGLPMLTGSVRMLHRGLIALNDENQLRQIHDVVANLQTAELFTTLRFEESR